MLGLRRYAVKYGTRCLAKFGKGSLSSSKNDQFLTNLTGNSSLSQKEQLVSLTNLKSCEISRLLKHFGLVLDSTSSFNGKKLTAVKSKAEMQELIGSDMPNVKLKNFMTCLKAFKIIGVPICLINDSTTIEYARITSLPSISKKGSQSNGITSVSTIQPNHTRDYTKVQVLKGHKDRVHSASLLSANQMVTTSDDKTLRFWNLETNECEQVWDNQEYGSVLATLSDGRIVVAGDRAGGSSAYAIKVYDHKTKLCVQTLKGHTDRVASLFVLDDNTIVSGSDDCTIRLWNPDTGVCLRKLEWNSEIVLMFAFSKDMIAFLPDYDNIARIWNVWTGECTQVLKCHPVSFCLLFRMPDGRIVSSNYFDKLIRIWNVETGMCESTLRSHTAAVTELAVLPDGRLVSGSYDNTIRIWNVNTGECEQVIETGHCIRNLLVLKDGRIVCSGNDDNGSLYIYG